jgi:hypothetical protein
MAFSLAATGSRRRLLPIPGCGRTMQQAQVEKQEGGERLPLPLDYTDLNSGELNSQATPGGMAQVTGYRLKFDPADTSQGIFFAAGGSATRVSIVGKNNPSELMFLVPASLAPGDYTLEIRSTIGNSTLYTGCWPRRSASAKLNFPPPQLNRQAHSGRIRRKWEPDPELLSDSSLLPGQ